jgi:hypothetical protein
MKDERRNKNVWKGASGLGFREGLLIRLEVIGYGLVAAILTWFLHALLSWFGVSDGLKLALSTIFGVTLFWLLAMYGIWAGIEGENRRKASDENGEHNS